jgi:serine/threonine kinase 16
MHSSHPEPLAHRDLKPGNVMFDHDFTPVLIDFGSVDRAILNVSTGRQARIVEDMAAEKCTMPYRAPELFMSDLSPVIDQRTDIWVS